LAARVRLDATLVDRGLVPSRERAKALILAGKVLVDGQVSTKAGTTIPDSAVIALKEADIPFVGRGGVKLAGALDAFQLDVSGLVFLDVGASTGGFTDCLLQRGAARVYAIDVGYGQLDWRLRNDPRVINLERINARHLDTLSLPEAADGAVIDVSFISLSRILPALRAHLQPGARVVALVKPQFEAGPKDVGKSGVVRDENIRRRVIADVQAAARALGFSIEGETPSPITGARGNREQFLLLVYPGMELPGRPGSSAPGGA
jgi:23S rRNA (cytidine1920-2'-O)/16S rRNA (cytidine1409-2'-O)-methyltransferase